MFKVMKRRGSYGSSTLVVEKAKYRAEIAEYLNMHVYKCERMPIWFFEALKLLTVGISPSGEYLCMILIRGLETS